MIRRGDEDRIDVRALQHLLVVNVRLGSRDFGRCPAKPLLVDITEANDLDVRFVGSVLKNQFEMVRAARAQAN